MFGLCEACGTRLEESDHRFCGQCEAEIRAEAEDYENFVLAQRLTSSDIPGELT